MLFTEELANKQKLINGYIDNIIKENDAPPIIAEAMNYSLKAGGKRIRPVLTTSICECLGGSIDEAMPFGCAIECIHTYSLIHDDLPAMDNDDLRRGKPTNHKVYGDAIAILAGDGLLNYAFELIGDTVEKNNCNPKYIKAFNIISKASGINGMIGGQVLDIVSEGKDISIDTLKAMHKMKTGALIKASCLSGCIIAGSEDKYSVVDEYSNNLGIAFQIVDDILDYVGDTAKLGKQTGVDSKNGKSTYVKMYGLDKSRDLAKEYSEKALKLTKEIDNSSFLYELTQYLLKRDN